MEMWHKVLYTNKNKTVIFISVFHVKLCDSFSKVKTNKASLDMKLVFKPGFAKTAFFWCDAPQFKAIH